MQKYADNIVCSIRMLFRLLVYVFLYLGRAACIFSLPFAEIGSHTLLRSLHPPKLAHSWVVTMSQLGNSSIHNIQLKNKIIVAKFTLTSDGTLTSQLQEIYEYYLLAQSCNFSVHFLKRSIPTTLQGLLGMLQFFTVSFAVWTTFPHMPHICLPGSWILDIVWPVCCASGSPDTEFFSKMALCYS